MSASAAAAEPPTIVDHHVSYLARGSRRPSAQLAIGDDARADAGADEDTDEVARLAAGPKILLAVGGDLHIVANHDGNVKRLTEQAAQRQVVKPFAKVWARDQTALLAVNLAGDTDADGRDLSRGLFRRRGERF